MQAGYQAQSLSFTTFPSAPSYPFPSPPATLLTRLGEELRTHPKFIRWPKYWSFSFIISPSNEYSGLSSFRIDWFNLLAVQGTPPIKYLKDIARYPKPLAWNFTPLVHKETSIS